MANKIFELTGDSADVYRKFINRLAVLHQKHPDLLKTTLANIFSMRYIGNKTHGDMAEIGLTEFINSFLYDYGCQHVGKINFRKKAKEEDIEVSDLINKEQFKISLKAYGEGPLQLSTDKVDTPQDGLYNRICELKGTGNANPQGKIAEIFNLPNFTNIAYILPLIYREKKDRGECNIMIFDVEKAKKETKYIYHIKKEHKFDENLKKVVKESKAKKKKRKYPIFLFLNEKYEYICEVRYGGKDANALQRGIWTDSKKADKYFTCFEKEWIGYTIQDQLIKLFAHALNSTAESHKKADDILTSDIKERLPKKENE